jgi:hypothetical protein
VHLGDGWFRRTPYRLPLFRFSDVVDSVAAIAMNNALCLKESFTVNYSSQTVWVNDSGLIEKRSLLLILFQLSRAQKKAAGDSG